jgi:3-isopropylmalate/(R)-2-methylmalate dehydratase small subunit
MQPFVRLAARACPLGLANVDTDQLIPARFMSRPRKAGYGGFLLHDLRFGPDGAPRPGSVIDDPRWAGAKVLVARRNFGTGSSREAAVYALADYGIRCVVAPSFGDIFASNAVKNGVLPAAVGEADAEALLAALEAAADPAVTVCLETQTVRCGDLTVEFAIDPVRRLQLLNGWDDIDLTLVHADAIAAFAERRRSETPWSVPGEGRSRREA